MPSSVFATPAICSRVTVWSSIPASTSRLHQLPVGSRTGGDLGLAGHPSGRRGPVAVGYLHRGHHRRDAVVGGAYAGAKTPMAGGVDGPGAGVQQRHICRVDLGWRAGNAAVHVLRPRCCCLPERVWPEPLGTPCSLPQLGGGGPDAAEGLLLAACGVGWFVGHRLLTAHRLDWRGTLALAGPFAVLIGAHFLARHSYYGEWLPNTYYAKHVGPWYESGYRYLSAAAIETGLYLLIPLAYVALRTRWRKHRDGLHALVCSV